MDEQRDESRCIGKEPCPKCKSQDNLARYDDGHAYCFTPSCDYFEPPTGEERAVRKPRDQALIPQSECEIPLEGLMKSRGLRAETLRKFGYGISEYNGKPVQVATMRDTESEQDVCQKLRFANKSFLTLGELKRSGLFGQHLWREGTAERSAKRIVITEGEIDAMSLCQAMGLNWPVVSVISGADGAAREIKRNLSFLSSYDEVVLCFDNDEAGREAVSQCAPLFPPGKCRIATLPRKDANEMLKAGLSKELVNAIWEARPWRPGGIVTLKDIRARVLQPRQMGLPYFLDDLTRATYGRQPGECVAWGGGVGCGKTDILLQQIEFDVSKLGQKVGLFLLEQPPDETGQRLAGKSVGKIFHIPGEFDPKELEAAFDALEARNSVFMHDHFGAHDWEEILKRIRWLYHNEDVRQFYLDHLTALSAKVDDERRGLDSIMADIGGVVKEMPIRIDFVSHLTTPEGKPHEEGGRVMAKHFKGSRAIMQWAHFIFGIERDTQAEDPALLRRAKLRCLKDRPTGRATGKTWDLEYGYDDGLLVPASPYKDESEDADDDECPRRSTSF